MTERMTAPLATLSAHNLRKKYKSQTVVTDVSFEVAAGEVVGLLGPNGAGKTTCFYMIVGLVASDGGEIRLQNGDGDAGANLTHMPIHKRARLGVSYLPQENSVFRKLTVEENVMAILQTMRLDKAESQRRLEELLQMLNEPSSERQFLMYEALRKGADSLAERREPVAKVCVHPAKQIATRQVALGYRRRAVSGLLNHGLKR